MSRAEYHLGMKDLPQEDRPRERLADKGPESLSASELLAIVIGSGTDRDNALELAGRLLERACQETGSEASPSVCLRYLLNASLEEIMTVRGIGRAKAVTIKAALELGRRLSSPGPKTIIRSPGDVSELVMDRLRYLEKEHFHVVLLDARNRVLGTELVSMGSLNASIVHPREVFKGAVRRAAAGVILVHNHPSGDPTPSAEDQDVTRRLVEVGNLLGIDVLDHIIVGDGRFVSMRERKQGWGTPS